MRCSVLWGSRERHTMGTTTQPSSLLKQTIHTLKWLLHLKFQEWTGIQPSLAQTGRCANENEDWLQGLTKGEPCGAFERPFYIWIWLLEYKICPLLKLNLYSRRSIALCVPIASDINFDTDLEAPMIYADQKLHMSFVQRRRKVLYSLWSTAVGVDYKQSTLSIYTLREMSFLRTWTKSAIKS